jgi:Flp pilus assembly protein TadG
MRTRNLKGLSDCSRGNITVTFALTLIPVVALMGAAVDYTRAAAIKTAMQAALDSTSLAMAAQATSSTAANLQASGLAYFSAMFKRKDATGLIFGITYSTSTSGPKVVVTASASVKTMFMNLPGFGIVSIPINGSSTAAWGNARLRVALALDNTGSMVDSGKMTSLKTAAKTLIDQLKAAATNPGDVYVSIIPFAKDVNVGATNYVANWLSWTNWNASNGSTAGCNWSGGGCTWTPANHNIWNGCVMDRDQNYDANNPAPTSTTYFPAEQYSDCPVQIMPLSYDWSALKSKIDAMSPHGYTNTTIGLSWGWDSLTQGAPLNAPAEDPKFVYTKVIIFLTDGDNTQNRWTTTQSQVDARMTVACTNAKAANITIYTILVLAGMRP